MNLYSNNHWQMVSVAIFIGRFIFWICLLFPVILFSQNKAIDSLTNELQHPKNDTFHIDILYNLAQEQYGYDSAKGMSYLNEGCTISKKMNFLFQVANYYQIKSKLLNAETDLVLPLIDSAISIYEKSMLQKQTPHLDKQARLSIASCKADKGNVLSRQGRFKEAIDAHIQSFEAWKLSNDPKRYESIATEYNNIATVYFNLKENQKAMEYDKLAIAYRLLDNNNEMLAMSYFFVSDDYVLLSNFDSALVYVQKARPLIEQINKHQLNYGYFNRTATIYRNKKNYGQAIVYAEKALTEANTTGNNFSISNANRSLALNYIKMNDYNTARKYLLKALTIQEENKYINEKIKTLNELVLVEEKTNPAQAYTYLKQLDAIKDSIKTNESKAAVAEIENKYQAAQKEKEIVQLQKDKQQQAFSIKNKSTLNKILIGSIVVLLLIAFLSYRNYRQKRQLQQQRISELETEKKLSATEAILKGQEEERSRLAKDLHDGLGGLLSGVKFSLTNMKDNLIVTPDNMVVFERSLDMIDTSIKELRRVAHNMMPEMLVKFGLDEAVKEYCNSVNATKLLTVKYQSFGMTERLDSSSEIIIYRIIQELLNNVLKHAAASEVLVQIIREGNRLNVLVEDNGKGFDSALLENNKGAGWANIKSRVDYLKGRLDIQSDLNKGTSVTIEFNV